MSVLELEVGKSYRLIIENKINRICTCVSSTGIRAIVIDNTGHHISLGLTDLIDNKVFQL